MKAAVIIMSGFAAWWFVWGLATFPAVPEASLAPVLISAVLIALALRAPACPRVEGVGRVVGRASAAEGIAILAAAIVLNAVGFGSYLPAATAVIVGLHFLPIARHLRFAPYYWAAGAMVAAAGAGVIAGSMALTCWAAAAILWLTCLAVLARARRVGAQAA